MMRVSELMTAAPVQVSADTPLATCAHRMHRLGIRHLLVVRPDGKLAGVLTDRGIHRHGTLADGAFVSFDRNTAFVASDLVVPTDLVARPDDELSSVLRRLPRTRQDWVVVLDGKDHPIGLLTEHDLLKVPLLVVPDGLTVEQLPARTVVGFDHQTLGASALQAMIRFGIRHVVVTGPFGVVVGVATYRDLVAADVLRRTVVLDEVRSGLVFSASSGDRLVDCAVQMLDRHVGCLPVLAQGRAVRIVTRRDLLDAAVTALEDESLFEGHESTHHAP